MTRTTRFKYVSQTLPIRFKMGASISELQKIYSIHLDQNSLPLPRIIHIETRSKCNGVCNFCPASAVIDSRQDEYMHDQLINKIIEELSSLDFSNRISFYNNNEPFLDSRIYELVRLAREKLPKAYLELKSNGKLLSTDKIIRIFNAGLDMLYINDYGDGKTHSKNIQSILAELNKIRRFKGHFDGGNYFSRIQINLRKSDAILGTKGGTSPNKSMGTGYLKKVCFRPFEMMTINPRGDVSICSNDFHYAMKTGNITNATLMSLWNSKEWNNLRHSLLKGERNCTDSCSKCDYVGVTQEMFKEQGLKPENAGLSFKRIFVKGYNLVTKRFLRK